MPKALYEIKVASEQILVQAINSAASQYCSYNLGQRQLYLANGDVYMSIELWNGVFITATPITSCQGHDLDEIKDFVLMDGPDIDLAIGASILCIIGGLKDKFVTQTDNRNADDILLWQLVKSS